MADDARAGAREEFVNEEPGSLIGENDVMSYLGVSKAGLGDLLTTGALRPHARAGDVLFSFDEVEALQGKPEMFEMDDVLESVIADAVSVEATETPADPGELSVLFEEALSAGDEPPPPNLPGRSAQPRPCRLPLLQ